MFLQVDEYDYDDEAYEDPQPVACSTTENIKGGRVTYSKVKKTTTTKKHHVRGLKRLPDEAISKPAKFYSLKSYIIRHKTQIQT